MFFYSIVQKGMINVTHGLTNGSRLQDSNFNLFPDMNNGTFNLDLVAVEYSKGNFSKKINDQ